MTKRIIILLIGCAACATIFFVVRNIDMQESFNFFGTARADAMNKIEEISQIKYADTLACKKCHASIDSTKNHSAHSKFNCQICHGPGIKHIADPAKNKMDKPDSRKFCVKCHLKDTSRTECIMQIDIKKHNPKATCTKCHNPHSPAKRAKITSDSKDSEDGDKSAVMTCSMCHDDKNTLKSSGVHKNLLCQSCHGTSEKHMQEPAANLMFKPSGNAFCSNCHGLGIASSTNNIKQIDIKDHNPDGKCIDCHDSHSPLKGF